MNSERNTKFNPFKETEYTCSEDKINLTSLLHKQQVLKSRPHFQMRLDIQKSRNFQNLSPG